MTDDHLDVYIDEQFAGSLARARDRSVTFEYDEAYADSPDTTALSLSMPKSRLVHRNDLAGAWFANLLPDSEKKLERIAASVGTRSIQPFDLLARIGHDVAGAVQVFPEGTTPEDNADLVELTESHIASELRGLRADPNYVPDEFGRWSLAGQQGKIAVALSGERWYAPTGTAASTHILKIGPDGMAGGDLAEFVTLRAAYFCGIAAPLAWLHRFDDQLAVVVARYDRQTDHSGASPAGQAPHVRRIHQEDMCQVLGVRPGLKYQSDGGPSAKGNRRRALAPTLPESRGLGSAVRATADFQRAHLLPRCTCQELLGAAPRLGGDVRARIRPHVQRCPARPQARAAARPSSR